MSVDSGGVTRSGTLRRRTLFAEQSTTLLNNHLIEAPPQLRRFFYVWWRVKSFCASGNRRDFLTDITGNRRWLPFEVESIQNPFHTIIPYERLYAQAKALVEEGIFSYWFDMEEMEVLEAHNEEFRAQENEEQLLPILFDVPAEGKGEFMTTAEISDRLATYGGIKKPMSIGKNIRMQSTQMRI